MLFSISTLREGWQRHPAVALDLGDGTRSIANSPTPRARKLCVKVLGDTAKDYFELIAQTAAMKFIGPLGLLTPAFMPHKTLVKLR